MGNQTYIDQRPLTQEEFLELKRCRKNPFFFSNHIKVIHPTRGKVPFNLYGYQVSTLMNFLTQKFNVILKFRQAGVTELISLYCLWLAMFHSHKNIVIISIKDRVAKKVLRKIKFMYNNLPDFLKIPVINGRGNDLGTATELEFVNGSIISSIPTTEDAGRSEALSLLVIDEAAIVRWADRIWAASWPTLSCSGYNTPVLLRKAITGYLKDYPKTETKVKKIGEVCPKEKGVMDISHLGYETLTHKGRWRKVLLAQNKGELETWYVVDCKGKKGEFTPKHRLYTTKGWKTVGEIIKGNLTIISVETNVDELLEPPKTIPPVEEVIKPIKDFPRFMVSNFGKVYRKVSGELKLVPARLTKDGYLRVGLTNGEKRTGTSTIYGKKERNKTFQRKIARLVYEAFIGGIPEGFQIDHINCNRQDDYITNLRAVSASENVKRSFDYNLNAKLSGITNDKLPNLKKRGKILEMYEGGYSYSQIAKVVYPNALQGSKFVKRLIKERGSRVYISKLKLIKKTIEPIFDIHVEEDHSYISANNYINHNTGGSAIVNSTAYGVGNFFHKLFVNAVAGGNTFNPIRLKWRMHPERDDEWYRLQAEILGPRRTAQEIDGDFLTSGNTVFDLADIRDIEDSIEDLPPIKTLENGNLRIFKNPKKGEKYYMGMDIASGRSRDYTAFDIMNSAGEQFMAFKGKIPIDKAERLAMKWCKIHNNALFAPESNDIGLGLATNVQNNGYPNLYYSRKLLKKRGKSKPEEELVPGWYTTKKNRPVIISGLEEDVRCQTVQILNPFFCQEAYTFIYDERNKPVAMNKDKTSGGVDDMLDDEVYTDDSILETAITNHIRKGRYKGKSVDPR